MRSKLTFANVMVVILTFIVLGGGAYAATQLPKNSVGAKQLKKGAVTKAKIEKKTLNELKGAVGQTGPAGPTGASGAPGGTIAAGTTLRGVAATGTGLSGAGLENGASFVGVSFGGSQLASRPSANLVPVGGASTASCPGTLAAPEAAPGNLCVYLKATQPEDETLVGISDVTVDIKNPSGLLYELKTKSTKTLGDGRISRFGFQFTVFAPEASSAQALGTWAVTAN